MLINPYPLSHIEKRLTGQCPALEIEQLLFVAIAFKHDIFVFTDPFNLSDSGFQFKNSQIMQTSERDEQIKEPGKNALPRESSPRSALRQAQGPKN